LLTLSLSSINRRLRGPLQGLLVLSLVFGVVLSANSQALMLWQMAAQNELVQMTAGGDSQAPAAMHTMPACHDMMSMSDMSGDAQHVSDNSSMHTGTHSSATMADCDASCPCCAGACSSFAMTLDMPRAIRSKQQSFSRYDPRPAAAVVLALPQRPPIFS
jgi:hypothetical protein